MYIVMLLLMYTMKSTVVGTMYYMYAMYSMVHCILLQEHGHVQYCTFCSSDSLLGWNLSHHWHRTDVPILLPVPQAKGHGLLPGRHCTSADWMANHWNASGVIWRLPVIWVRPSALSDSLYHMCTCVHDHLHVHCCG